MHGRVNRWRRIGFFCGRYFVDYKSNIDGMRIVLIAVFLTNHRRSRGLIARSSRGAYLRVDHLVCARRLIAKKSGPLPWVSAENMDKGSKLIAAK